MRKQNYRQVSVFPTSTFYILSLSSFFFFCFAEAQSVREVISGRRVPHITAERDRKTSVKKITKKQTSKEALCGIQIVCAAAQDHVGGEEQKEDLNEIKLKNKGFKDEIRASEDRKTKEKLF